MGAAHDVRQLVQVELDHHLVTCGAKPIEAAFGDFFRDQDSCHSPIVTGRGHGREPH